MFGNVRVRIQSWHDELFLQQEEHEMRSPLLYTLMPFTHKRSSHPYREGVYSVHAMMGRILPPHFHSVVQRYRHSTLLSRLSKARLLASEE